MMAQKKIFNACVIVVLFSLNACDSGTSIGEFTDHDNAGALEELNSVEGSLPKTVQYVYGHFENGSLHTVRITLDPDFVQERQSFKSFDDYFDELDVLMDQEELTVNESLYNRLIHALYPAEIRLLDTTGEVVIDGYLYTSTEQASYRRPLGAPVEAQELEEYWGEDGTAVERELATLHRYMDQPEDLATFPFRNPHIKSEAENIRNGIAEKAPPDNARYVTREWKKGYTVCLPNSRSGEAGLTPQCYPVKFLLWNQSTTTKKRRAIAGIQVFVELPSGLEVTADRGPLGLGTRVRLKVTAIGGHTERTEECYGDLRVGDFNTSFNPPYTSIRTEKSCNHITVVANRKAKRGARSRNSVGFEDYFTPTKLSDGQTYLVFSNRGWWEFEDEEVQ